MSWPRAEPQVVQHFTHIHPLTKVDGFGRFTCNGCKTYGYGKTYRCASCDYDLHDYCATCPPTLLSFMHPQHELRLVSKGLKHKCDICQDIAEGLYYRCDACDFDVHPLCTQLPRNVSHVHHPAHLLELSNWGASNMCMVCQGAIQSWRYKCGPCWLDVHLECVNTSASAARGIQQRSSVPQPDLHPSHHVCGCRQNCGHTNQGQGQVPRPSKRKVMFGILTALTVGVASNVIGDQVEEVFSGWF